MNQEGVFRNFENVNDREQLYRKSMEFLKECSVVGVSLCWAKNVFVWPRMLRMRRQCCTLRNWVPIPLLSHVRYKCHNLMRIVCNRLALTLLRSFRTAVNHEPWTNQLFQPELRGLKIPSRGRYTFKICDSFSEKYIRWVGV